MSLKTENSRRVAKSRPVCMGLYAMLNCNEYTIYSQPLPTGNNFNCRSNNIHQLEFCAQIRLVSYVPLLDQTNLIHPRHFVCHGQTGKMSVAHRLRFSMTLCRINLNYVNVVFDPKVPFTHRDFYVVRISSSDACKRVDELLMYPHLNIHNSSTRKSHWKSQQRLQV